MTDSEEYDFAFSFAGEHRSYVEAVKVECEKLGLKVFYDRDKNNEWWGRNFLVEQRKIYGSQTRHFVAFISPEYFSKPIPTDEFQSAMMTAARRGDGYILPVLIGDVNAPPELLPPHTHYLRAEEFGPAALARELQRRLHSTSHRNDSQDVAEVVQNAAKPRMPKTVPQTFSKHREAKIVFDYLAASFEDMLRQLNQLGFVGTVEKYDERITVRIEQSGTTTYALDIRRGGSFGGDGALEFSLDGHRHGGGGVNAWANPTFDIEAGVPKLELMDLSLLRSFGGGQTEAMTKEELFSKLWERIVDRIEGRH